MKKVVCTIVLLFFWMCALKAQPSVSLNYLYLGNKEKYASKAGVVSDIEISKKLVNHGIGIQSKIPLKSRLYLMSDLSYLFGSDEMKIKDHQSTSYNSGTGSTDTYHYRENREHKVSYYSANVNLTYAFPLNDFFTFFPIVGAGYFHEYSRIRTYYAGIPPSTSPPEQSYMDVIAKLHSGSIVCNLGFNLELYMSKNIFVNAGLKYLIDIYDTKYNGFPLICAGIGYSFNEKQSNK